MKQILRKTLLVLLGGVMSTAAWAEVVPTPVYFNDFSFATSGSDGIEIVGNGEFEDDADARFGKIFHNDPGATPEKGIRTNYLKLPDNVLSHSTTTKEITIGFWVNVKNAADYWFSPIFSAYALSPAENAAESRLGNEGNFPMFVLQSRGLMQLNNGGYDNFEAADNVAGTNAESTVWLDDKAWHYYTMTMTTSKAIIYIDGVIKNEWNIAGTDGHYVEGFFTYGGNYKYICLGGNQAWNWGDPDPAYAFDDFAVYDVALSKAQIDQIRANKLNRTVTGTKIGNIDGSTEYLAASSTQKTLYPGDSYHYSFINYNNGSTNWNNWVLPVYNTSDTRVITVRADNYEDIVGANTGCTSNFNFTNFPGNINGATYDMTVTFTAEKKFNMSASISTVDGSSWTYSYTNDYTGSAIDLTSDDYINVALSVSRSWLDVQSEGYSAIGAAIGATEWGTYVSEYPLDFTGYTDVKAYKVTGRTTTSIITEQLTGIVPAGTPMLLNAPGGAGTYTVPVATSAGTPITGNCMQAGTGAAVSQDGSYDRYVLVNNSGTAVFKKIISNPATVATNRAYLQFTAGSLSRDILDIDGGDATGINMVNGEGLKINGSEVYYNLQGQRVLYPTKGLYVVNGKKVIVK